MHVKQLSSELVLSLINFDDPLGGNRCWRQSGSQQKKPHGCDFWQQSQSAPSWTQDVLYIVHSWKCLQRKGIGRGFRFLTWEQISHFWTEYCAKTVVFLNMDSAVITDCSHDHVHNYYHMSVRTVKTCASVDRTSPIDWYPMVYPIRNSKSISWPYGKGVRHVHT